ncbi:RrF2 family transcriptional regulator [Methyloferula stellata]|uniref:RrF2 family transcriptional regulator n=1 Tax=Methyloferula stellata TaxID=876270 RepID=UPI000369D23B|nr:Rrf2 family transcriptional regulator [Methyloferula stellata]
MIFLPRRCLLALAAVADIAIHARPQPVAAKALAARLDLPPRHLETLLQALVRANILKGLRGPRGGYELTRERRRITAAEILRAVMEDLEPAPDKECALVSDVVVPMVSEAEKAFMSQLETVTIDDLCRRADEYKVFKPAIQGADFTI